MIVYDVEDEIETNPDYVKKMTGGRSEPLLSIGWWYLSSESPKGHCCRVSAADKGCRVYPLDPRPDAVALYSGCTSGKRRAWFCQMTGTLPPLVGLRGGRRHARMRFFLRIWIKSAVPG
ncbi:uncharacterized protein TNCV_3937991 [Trichonephila clavipes]|nr:uncharacterized protein TNCV_3937991 [Trichonephila clavipes]